MTHFHSILAHDGYVDECICSGPADACYALAWFWQVSTEEVDDPEAGNLRYLGQRLRAANMTDLPGSHLLRVSGDMNLVGVISRCDYTSHGSSYENIVEFEKA